MEGNREFALSESPSGSDGDGNWVGGPGLVRSLWRYRLVIAVVTVLGALGGFAVSLLLPARYEAQAHLYLRDPGSPAVLTLGQSTPSQSGDHAVFMATQAGLASSDAVYGRALQILGRPGTPDDIRASVVVGPSADLSSLTVRATSDDPAEAANLANAVGTAYDQVAGEHTTADSKEAIARLQDVVAQRQVEYDALNAQIAQSSGAAQAVLERKALHVGDLIGSLQANQSDIAAQAALHGSGVESFERAAPPAASSQPTPVLLALIGAVIGLVGSGVWAWWAAGRDRRVEEEGDAAEILGVPLLGETPRLGAKLEGAEGPSALPSTLDPVAAEAYHVVLASLEHALARAGGKIVTVASARAGDGKTVTVLNLALAAQREGRKVLLVDADERTRRLSQLCRDGEYFEVNSTSHVTDERPAFTTGGTVLQIGPSDRNGHHPAVFFRSTTFASMISHWAEEADLVIVDTPPLLEVSEAVTIADHADAVLVVVNRGASLADLRRARERLAFTDTPLIGYVLTRGSAQRAYGADGRLRHWRPGKLPQLARRG
ncbi:P-loop NTPase [Pseudonocardia kujensis]|uniref:P-loop NTPase n=1 Tax=Pseudonocardia kujensis TaxID=1128675 RepID=UPI0027E09B77|nr:P-loop NTPase [Pseudonocardia kujensis]